MHQILSVCTVDDILPLCWFAHLKFGYFCLKFGLLFHEIWVILAQNLTKIGLLFGWNLTCSWLEFDLVCLKFDNFGLKFDTFCLKFDLSFLWIGLFWHEIWHNYLKFHYLCLKFDYFGLKFDYFRLKFDYVYCLKFDHFCSKIGYSSIGKIIHCGSVYKKATHEHWSHSRPSLSSVSKKLLFSEI